MIPARWPARSRDGNASALDSSAHAPCCSCPSGRVKATPSFNGWASRLTQILCRRAALVTAWRDKANHSQLPSRDQLWAHRPSQAVGGQALGHGGLVSVAQLLGGFCRTAVVTMAAERGRVVTLAAGRPIKVNPAVVATARRWPRPRQRDQPGAPGQACPEREGS